MTTPKKKDPPSPAPPKEPQPSERTYGLLLAAVITTVVLAVLVMIVHYVPQLVARYVIERELEQMGIANEGIGSLSIDLWRRQAHLGHMRFGGGPENQGQIGRVSVKYRLVNLLHEQAVIEQMVIEGIDVHVVRGTDGKIDINGIDLDQFVAAEQQAESVAEEESGWGAGLDKFELRNSRVIFTDSTGGTLTLDVERLDLAGFRTFEPDQPGTFELVANLNEIPLHWSGEARPFADTITVAIDTKIDDVDFAKIEKYTGPLGLERRSGVLDTEFTHNVTFFPNGRIEVGSDGNIEIRNADTLYPNLFGVRYDDGNMGLATSFVLDESGNIQLTGSISVDLENWDIDATGTGFGAAAASIKFPDFSLTRDSEGAIDLVAKPQLAIDRPRISGAASGEGTRISLDLSELKVKQAGESLSVSTTGTTTLDGLKVTLPQATADGAPAPKPLDVAFAKATLDLAKLVFSSTADAVRLDARPKLSVDALNFDGPAKGAAKSINLDLSALTVEQTGANLSLTAAGTTALDAFNLTLAETVDRTGSATAEPIRLDFARAKLDLARALLAMKEGSLRFDAQPKLSVDAPEFGGPVQISSETLNVDLPDLKVEQTGEGLSVTVAGTTALGASKLSMPKTDAVASAESAEPLNLAFSQATLDLTRMLLAVKQGGLRLDAEPRLTVNSLDLGGPAQATMARLDVALETLDLTSEAENLSVAASGTAGLSSLQASATGETALFPVKLDFGNLNVDLKEGGWDAMGAESRWNARFDTKLGDLAASLAEGSVGRAKLRELVLEGGSTDQAMNFAANTLVIGGLDLQFDEKLFSTPETGAETEVKDAKEEQPGTSSSLPVIKVQKLALSDPAKINFRDTSVTPSVVVDMDIEKLQIANLDTGNPSQKTDLQLAATLNKLTKLQLSGWSQAMTTPKPSFDLNGEVKNAQLAPFSSYAAKAVGLNLESGKLDLDAKAKAAAGKLGGDINLDVLDLDFSPLSAQDAERLSAKVGLPIETAVGLLQDSNGRIKLKLPVSGTVEQPDFDLSQAIGKAVGGALKSIFPPTAIASLISSGLEGAGKVGLQFKPIPFAPGETALGPEARQLADKVAELLKERPKLRLKVCGRATAADFDVYLATALTPETAPQPAASADARPASPAAPAAPSSAPTPAPAASGDMQQLLEKARSNLTELATERGRNVRQYVVGEHGIKPDSLGECRSAFDSTDQGPPRVRVTF